MDEVYAIKQTQFLGKPIHYVCQSANGPCPLLAIANVLLLRGQLSLEGVIETPGHVSAHNLMHLVHRRLLDTNPPLNNASELERLTQEKTLKDVAEMLPKMLVGLDVNVRFHNITDFEYTVACAVFDMLDIVLVHGWLLDEQDMKTMEVVGNKSYNELIERLVDYRGVLLTENSNEAEKPIDVEALASNIIVKPVQGEEEKCTQMKAQESPLAAQTTRIQNLSIDVGCAQASDHTLGSPNSGTVMILPKTSPSKQTLETMMMERHMSDADALDTATTLLDEGPILEEFFNLTANQLTYYGLVKLHEGVRERQLCVFFRNNHFSTLFKFEGALYLLVTDAGYLEEPTVVWELLNGIDGDTAYLDAQFRPVTFSEHQKNILTQQLQQREQQQCTDQEEQKASDKSLTGRNFSKSDGELNTNGINTTTTGDPLLQSEVNIEEKDEDYLLALKIQQEEEVACHNTRVSPRHLQAVEKRLGDSKNVGSSLGDEHAAMSVSADGLMIVSEEELEAQRQAERFYEEKKRQIDAQSRQIDAQSRLRQQQFQPHSYGAPRRSSTASSDCNIS
ncbi:Uncharacterized conserved protein [Plasmopara halstedii]|uniref:Uncharacterized conserved protein n=1 Tax=Plasmopara halstedii TaxID=4781 RepID=A0A0P1B836_PLAHL|nr:Uncharacterized conserved protein [Plasmopara halstedii]CEG50312.1 Uncharacterized conserved protein [Plasmopara halstedii]|eukprot:XP_024586681.1 Uncharacterized conserved protein [Plasmopara halstedii]